MGQTQTNLVAQPRTKEKRTKEPWRVPSRPHVSPPEARPQESSSPLRPRGSPPQPSEASRNLTGTDPEPSLFVRLEGTRSPPSSSSGSFPSRDSSGRSPRLQVRLEVPVLRRPCFAGGFRGLPRRSLRGHQLVRHPRQACHHHAKGHPVGQKNPWRACLSL